MMKIIIFLAAIAYGVWPLDVIPDVAPGIGWVDDAVVLGIAIWNFLSKGKQPRRVR